MIKKLTDKGTLIIEGYATTNNTDRENESLTITPNAFEDMKKQVEKQDRHIAVMHYDTTKYKEKLVGAIIDMEYEPKDFSIDTIKPEKMKIKVICEIFDNDAIVEILEDKLTEFSISLKIASHLDSEGRTIYHTMIIPNTQYEIITGCVFQELSLCYKGTAMNPECQFNIVIDEEILKQYNLEFEKGQKVEALGKEAIIKGYSIKENQLFYRVNFAGVKMKSEINLSAEKIKAYTTDIDDSSIDSQFRKALRKKIKDEGYNLTSSDLVDFSYSIPRFKLTFGKAGNRHSTEVGFNSSGEINFYTKITNTEKEKKKGNYLMSVKKKGSKSEEYFKIKGVLSKYLDWKKKKRENKGLPVDEDMDESEMIFDYLFEVAKPKDLNEIVDFLSEAKARGMINSNKIKPFSENEEIKKYNEKSLKEKGFTVEKAKRQGRRSDAQTPADQSEQISGSNKNPGGSASSNSNEKIELSKTQETALKKKVEEFNKKNPEKKITLSQLKKVWRRGAGAFSSSHRPSQNRSSWAMARVNTFLDMVAGKKVKESYKEADGDLLTNNQKKKAKKLNYLMLIKKAKTFEERRDEVFKEYKDTVNMSYSELLEWSKNPKSKLASVNRDPINRNLKLLAKKKEDWTKNDLTEAKKVIAYKARAITEGKGVVTEETKPFGRNEIALRNWAIKI